MTLMHVFKAMTDDLTCEQIAALMSQTGQKDSTPVIQEAPKAPVMALNLF
jgi:hypothetical protein